VILDAKKMSSGYIKKTFFLAARIFFSCLKNIFPPARKIFAYQQIFFLIIIFFAVRKKHCCYYIKRTFSWPQNHKKSCKGFSDGQKDSVPIVTHLEVGLFMYSKV